ncbi:hypothetical protein FACS1894110_17070 [Spirochaetia bacterium]|nr:hypothetical protein FACS1894110_17070 [Spirochaetia bacterium]
MAIKRLNDNSRIVNKFWWISLVCFCSKKYHLLKAFIKGGNKISILLSGDFHAGSTGELSNICRSKLKGSWGDKYDTIKFQIILGDAGFLWPGNERADRYNLKQLGFNPWPILFLPGNHEPVLGMDLGQFKVADLGFGRPVYEILPNVYYMERGYIYNIDGMTLAVLGGGLSIDKAHRTEGLSWWPEEQWSFTEEKECLTRMEGQTVDYVLSHVAPNSIAQKLFHSELEYSGDKFIDRVAIFTDEIIKVLKYKQFYFAHWHFDRAIKEFCCLWKKTALITKDSCEEC